MADENIRATSPARPTPADRGADETIKETIESIVIAFILAFVFRAYVVEAFVIPTGSMAPTLLGAHTSVTCDQCGYHFESDWPREAMVSSGPESLPRPLAPGESAVYTCPMCRAPNTLAGPATPQSGDRILVHKYLYTVSEPRRWDVVVFKNPSSPHQNYIKRLVGLPEENLHLYEGNVYVQPAPADAGEPGAWTIARKPERPEVQRAVFQPVYHSQYIPRDEGRGRLSDWRWAVPWATSDTGAWTLEQTRSYTYEGDGPSEIRFDFARAVRAVERGYFPPALYAYNQRHDEYDIEPVEEVRVAALVQAGADGLSVRFSTTARLPGLGDDAATFRLRATLRSDGQLVLDAFHPESGEATPLVETAVGPLREGDRRSVELWYVDQQASVWIDGKRVLKHDFDASLEAILARPALPGASVPQIAIEVDRPAMLHNVEVDRDLYYQDRNRNGPARGMVNPVNRIPLHLGRDEFFCVGDNGPRSFDGRFWDEASLHPWVRTQFLADRVARDEDAAGVVPREMMMGRAFFVYFPAPYSAGLIPLPNFGDMRFIH